ncbi:hypothetical protein [Streptomyces sp. NPDC088748]|uniref:hypothetical protein n=1 Tax=Streptomyces sp. NPDC088748 TaxID=3365887 RepID=UPI0037F4DB59
METLRLQSREEGPPIKSMTAVNQFKNIRVSVDAGLREALAGLSNLHLFKQCADLDDTGASEPAGAARRVPKLLTRRITVDPGDRLLNRRIATGVEASVPGLRLLTTQAATIRFAGLHVATVFIWAAR